MVAKRIIPQIRRYNVIPGGGENIVKILGELGLDSASYPFLDEFDLRAELDARVAYVYHVEGTTVIISNNEKETIAMIVGEEKAVDGAKSRLEEITKTRFVEN